MGCVGAILFLVCETSGLDTKLDSQDSDEEQILPALRRARIGSRRQIALSAPGSGAQLGATATPPVTPVSFHHGVLDDPHFEEHKAVALWGPRAESCDRRVNFSPQHLDYAAEVHVAGVNAATMTLPTATPVVAVEFGEQQGEPRSCVCQAPGALIRVSTCGVLHDTFPFWVHADYCLNTDAS